MKRNKVSNFLVLEEKETKIKESRQWPKDFFRVDEMK